LKKKNDSHLVDVAIWRVSHHHRYIVNSRLESMGLYRGQHRLIWCLSESDGLTHSALAERLRISNATVSKMVQRMEQNGFVKRQPDQHDQRISRVFLTEKGREIEQKLRDMFFQLEADEIEGFSETEIEQLVDFLARINVNLMKHIPHHQEHKKTTKKKEDEA
jgi:DNA-binding MarR family transcriptional regulator